MMPIKMKTLVPLSLARDIVNSVSEDDIVSYEAGIISQNVPNEPDREISIIEVKIAFETKKRTEEPGGGDRKSDS